MEATLDERKNLAELSESRSIQNQEENQSANAENPDESSSNIITLVVFLPLAIAADLLGALDLTGFGAIIVRIINFPILGTLWLWRILKTGPKKDATLQLITGFLIEQSPFGIVPTWTVLVLYFYFQDTKLGKKTIGKFKELSKIKGLVK